MEGGGGGGGGAQSQLSVKNLAIWLFVTLSVSFLPCCQLSVNIYGRILSIVSKTPSRL